jgi:hypothetical protein
VAHETSDSLGISTERDCFLCALQAEMEETVDDLKLKIETEFL